MFPVPTTHAVARLATFSDPFIWDWAVGTPGAGRETVVSYSARRFLETTPIVVKLDFSNTISRLHTPRLENVSR